jgi:hypothetical protein
MEEKVISMKSLAKAFDIRGWLLLIDKTALFGPGIVFRMAPARLHVTNVRKVVYLTGSLSQIK